MFTETHKAQREFMDACWQALRNGWDDPFDCPIVQEEGRKYQTLLERYSDAIQVFAADAIYRNDPCLERIRKFHDIFAKLAPYSEYVPLYAMERFNPVELAILNSEIF